ncbi:MAG: glycosyltransferase, partial [bacterium]
VINEAASAGLPVVMIDKDITSVVKNNVNGIIAKPNKEDLAQSILKILNSDELELTMSNESRLLAQQYTEKKQAEKLLSIYQELLAEYDKTIHLKD